MEKILQDLRCGNITVEAAQKAITAELGLEVNLEEVGVKIDNQRDQRTGMPEVVYGEFKNLAQLMQITATLHQKPGFLITRIKPEMAGEILAKYPQLAWNKQAGLVHGQAIDKKYSKPIGILSAGSSDQSIAEEAAVTSELMGMEVLRFYDVGVAGVHRLFKRLDDIKKAGCLVVVAGMDGALPSLIGGLVKMPIVAVPTSVGYGASFEGLAPLLTMLNSCSSGVTVVNIDNGYGAAMAGVRILQKE
ncbi:MAG: nickel pincer cofactor biosynthesis protein LarB [SAR324 cluster bacterium]|nr:nickel pincer cofactor biosynthesis protein LarB [SAR324 cluster bacterium]